MGRPLADEAEAAQAQVEQDEGVDGDADPVLDDAAAAEDADAGGQRPGHQHKVDGDTGDRAEFQSREPCGDDQGEQGVPYDAHALGEGAAGFRSWSAYVAHSHAILRFEANII